MLDILAFLALGILFGLLMGLVPGIHPNMIVLAVPFLAALGLPDLNLLAFIVAIGVTNVVVDFVPSILLGAPDAEKALSVLPGHRMLLAGQGYEAVKLAVIGSLFSVILVALAFPALAIAVPALFSFLSPVIWLLLGLVAAVMIFSEEGMNRLWSLLAFCSAGYIGVLMARLPVDSSLLLFPILSGFFGVSVLLMQMRSRNRVPGQRKGAIHMTQKTINRAVVSGTAGGIFSGFLPGVGASEVAALTSIDNNDRSFLVSLGAIAMANTILSIMSLWLISRPRSGLAVAIDSLTSIGFGEVIFIISVAIFCAGIASFISLRLVQTFLAVIEKMNYSLVSCLVVALVISLVIAFTGIFGVLLLATSAAIGIAINLAGIRRGVLMGVLMVPTMLFYAGL